MALDTREVRYASYLAGVKRQIEALWGYPAEARDRGIGGELFLVFSIAADGHLAGLQLIRGSGVTILDQEALEAIRRAAPFAPFPPRLQPLGTIHITACFLYQTGYARAARGACS
jgi:protein TonB